MRVLTVGNMYPPHNQGGYELMWRSSVAHLRGAGHEVSVLTTDHREPSPDPGIPEDPAVRRELRWYWRGHRWPRLGLMDRLRLERHNLARLGDALEAERPDAIAWWSMGGMSLSLIGSASATGVPGVGVVVDEWLRYAPREDQWHRGARRAGPLGAALSRLAGVPAPSISSIDRELEWVVASEQLAKNAALDGWRLPARTVVHAGVELDLFTAAPAAPWRDRWLYVGRLDERKGVATAIEAVGRRPGARLRVVGRGESATRARLAELAGSCGAADRVSFDEVSRDRLAEAYAEADAVLFPVHWSEPSGIVPLEAMAVGRPVIATGTGGSGEYLSDGVNCLTYSPPQDADALVAAMARLASDATLRSRIVEGGAETARRLDRRHFDLAVERALERVA